MMQPEMLADEIEVLARYYRAARRIVEFGSGGSTFLAATQTNATIYSVESDVAWIEKMRALPEIAKAEAEGRLKLIHANIGPTRALGYPADESAKRKWRHYPEAPWRYARKPDLVFVDGRFRAACIFMAIRKTWPRTLILVHDFWNRPQYHAPLPFLRCVERIETLAVFRRRWFVNRQEVKSGLRQSRFDPS